MTGLVPCPWCDKQFGPAKRGAHSKRFCSSRCRNLFHAACRRLTGLLVQAGAITPAVLKQWDAILASCMTRTTAKMGAGVPDLPAEANAALIDLFRSMKKWCDSLRTDVDREAELTKAEKAARDAELLQGGDG